MIDSSDSSVLQSSLCVLCQWWPWTGHREASAWTQDQLGREGCLWSRTKQPSHRPLAWVNLACGYSEISDTQRVGWAKVSNSQETNWDMKKPVACVITLLHEGVPWGEGEMEGGNLFPSAARSLSK